MDHFSSFYLDNHLQSFFGLYVNPLLSTVYDLRGIWVDIS